MAKTLGNLIEKAKTSCNMESKIFKQLMIYGGVILLQFGFAGFAIIAKLALNKGVSHYTFAVYRNAIAAVIFAPFAFVLERKIRPKMTLRTLAKIMLLGFLDPIVGQNLFYAGMKYSTATFASAMCNVLPALTFLMAWILRVEKVDIKKLHSQAKILGTLVTVGGAMIMTLIRGPDIGLPWTKDQTGDTHSSGNAAESPIKGAIMIAASNIGYSLFYILQATTLKSYPAGLSLTTLICTFGALQGVALTLVVERGNTEIWALGWNAKFLAYAYGGIVSSGITYYVSGIIMKVKGPVFVTSFNPFNMVIVAILSSFIFAEQLDVGKVTGALVICIGLYLVIWGKRKDLMDPSNSEPQLNHEEETQLGTNPSKVAETNGVKVSNTISGNNIV